LHFTDANETLFIGDVTKLMKLYAKKQMWAEAAKLAEEHEGNYI
jgi:hypothetical protein